ncbi:MAG: AzlD domain-containing protein [Paludibacteraceae bacterium]|nr:AzlD domain-containing protein [Paludibacteraceae bacterium]
MDKHNLMIYLLLMIVVTNLIRIIPVLFIKGPIKNRFVRSFLHYVPYVTLSVMTFPAIVETTGEPLAGAMALVGGVVAAWMGLGLFPVALVCCFFAYIL